MDLTIIGCRASHCCLYSVYLCEGVKSNYFGLIQMGSVAARSDRLGIGVHVITSLRCVVG